MLCFVAPPPCLVSPCYFFQKNFVNDCDCVVTIFLLTNLAHCLPMIYCLGLPQTIFPRCFLTSLSSFPFLATLCSPHGSPQTFDLSLIMVYNSLPFPSSSFSVPGPFFRECVFKGCRLLAQRISHSLFC